MRSRAIRLCLAVLLSAPVAGRNARAAEKPDMAQAVAPTGRLRAAINLGNPVLARTQDGALQGISVDLARRLAERLALPLDLVPYEAAGRVSADARTGAWDVAFLAADPARAAGIAFTAPYLVIEGTYMVRQDAASTSVEAVDRDGLRIAVGRGSAYDLFLTRTIRHAALVRVPTSSEAIDLFVRDRLDAVGGVRQPLARYAAEHPGYRVLAGRFMAIEQAMGVPLGREAALADLRAFVEEAKATGFVAEAIRRHDQPDALVAPPAAPASRE